jgi:hypothetical protein
MLLLKRMCLRLDNGTRIGALGSDGGQIIKLDFVEGFRKGVVSEDDLIRISEIAGQLEAQRSAAATPQTKAQVRGSCLHRASHAGWLARTAAISQSSTLNKTCLLRADSTARALSGLNRCSCSLGRHSSELFEVR